MNVRKFYGATTRDALRQVRDVLGADALILSNRQVAGGGVEIMAIAEGDVAALTNIPKGAVVSPAQRVAAATLAAAHNRSNNLNRTYAVPIEDSEDGGNDLPPAFVLRSNRASVQPHSTELPPAQTIKPVASKISHEALFGKPAPAQIESREANAADASSAPKPPREEVYPSLGDNLDEKPAPTSPPVDPELKEDIGSIISELKFLRTLVEGQLAGFAWGEMQDMDPTQLEIFRRMLAAGFSPALTRQILTHLPTEYELEAGLKWINTALVHNLPAIGVTKDIIETGGIFALVGPTGVGKTTTVAKLAARCTLKHGPGRVALITTDSYRIGAHDQLRIYGKILGVTVYAVKDETDLHLTLADLADKHLVLIDTVGMSQRDKRVEEQVAMLGGKDRHIRRLLLLTTTAQGAQLDDVVARYMGDGLEGVVLTKVDEAAQVGAAIDVIIRRKLPLYYVTNGQRVPEDLHLANPLYLIDRALRIGPNGVHALKEDEYPIYMAAVSNPTDNISQRRPSRSSDRG